MELFRILGTVAIDGIDTATGDLQRMSQAGEDANNRLNASMDAVNSSSNRLLIGIGALAVAIGALAVRSINTAATFEQSFNVIAAATGAPAEEIESLEALALRMGRTTAFSANQVAEAMLELAKGGLTPAQMQAGVLEQTLNLAAASGMGLADAAQFTKSVMLQFGVSSEDTGYAVNALAGAANSAMTGVSDLANAFPYVAGSAAGLGISINDLTGTLAMMSDQGFVGSQAGTSLNAMLTGLARPTDQAASAMESLGLTFVDSYGELKSMEQIAGQLQNALGDLTGVQQQNYLQTMFGVQGSRAATAMLIAGEEGLRGYIEATHDMTAAQTMADARMGGHMGAMQQLSGTLETLQIVIGQKLIPIIAPLIERFTAFAGRVIEFVQSEDFGETMQRWLPLLKAIGAAILVAVLPAVLGLAAGFVAMMLPLLPLMAAGAALVGLFYAIQNSSGVMRVGLIALAAVVGTFTLAMLKATQAKKLAAIGAAAKNAVDLITLGLLKKKTAATTADTLATTKNAAAAKKATLAAIALKAAKIIKTAILAPLTVAKLAFNIVMTMNPVITIATAIIALIAGLALLGVALVNGARSQERANQRADEFGERTKENTASMRDNLAEMERSEQGQSALANAYRRGLQSIDEQSRGIENAIRTYRLSARAIEDLQAAQDAHIAAVQRTINLTRELDDLQNASADTKLRLMDAEDRVAEAQERVAEAIAKYGADSREARRATLELESAQVRLNSASGDLAEAQYMLATGSDRIAEARKEEELAHAAVMVQLAATTGNTDELNDTLARLAREGTASSKALRDAIIADAIEQGIEWNEEYGKMEVDTRNFWQRTGDGASKAWQSIRETFSIANVKAFFGKVWDGIKEIFGGIADWFGGIFKRAWDAVRNVFSAGGRVFVGITEGIKNFFRTVVNGIIRGINSVVSVPFNAIDGALRRLRDLNLPVIGRPFGFLPRINAPQIPELASGGVLYDDTLFRGGEYSGARSNPEIVTPQNIMRETFGEVLEAKGGGSNSLVVDLLKSLIDEVRGLRADNERMQMVLDSGELVGAIQPKLDQSMHNISLLRRRGVAT